MCRLACYGFLGAAGVCKGRGRGGWTGWLGGGDADVRGGFHVLGARACGPRMAALWWRRPVWRSADGSGGFRCCSPVVRGDGDGGGRRGHRWVFAATSRWRAAAAGRTRGARTRVARDRVRVGGARTRRCHRASCFVPRSRLGGAWVHVCPLQAHAVCRLRRAGGTFFLGCFFFCVLGDIPSFFRWRVRGVTAAARPGARPPLPLLVSIQSLARTRPTPAAMPSRVLMTTAVAAVAKHHRVAPVPRHSRPSLLGSRPGRHRRCVRPLAVVGALAVAV